MKIEVKTTFNFDLAAERARLLECFGDEPEILARQNAILDAFEFRQFSKVVELYNALPQSKKDGCSEKEYTSEAVVNFFDFVLWNKNECVVLPPNDAN